MRILTSLFGLMLAIGVTGCGARAANTATAPAPAGRFEIVHSPHLERDTQLLDTYTGRTWVLVTDKNDVMSWEEMSKH